MALTVTGTPRKPLAGKEREDSVVALVATNGGGLRLPVDGLIRDRANVAGVIRVGPLNGRASRVNTGVVLCAARGTRTIPSSDAP